VAAALAIVGGGLLIAGSSMPWLSATVALVGSISKSGMDGDGMFTLIAGLAAVLLGVFMLTPTPIPKPILGLVPICAGLVGLAVVAMNWSEIRNRVAEFTSTAGGHGVASVGNGLYVIVIGGLFAIVAGIVEVAGELGRRVQGVGGSEVTHTQTLSA
jgi:hypothetical protein